MAVHCVYASKETHKRFFYKFVFKRLMQFKTRTSVSQSLPLPILARPKFYFEDFFFYFSMVGTLRDTYNTAIEILLCLNFLRID